MGNQSIRKEGQWRKKLNQIRNPLSQICSGTLLHLHPDHMQVLEGDRMAARLSYTLTQINLPSTCWPEVTEKLSLCLYCRADKQDEGKEDMRDSSIRRTERQEDS